MLIINQQTNMIYAITYNHAGKLAGYTKSEDSIQTANWSFYYGPFGLEKAYRSTSPTITEDFTTAPDGRILSMTYTEAGGSYNGEYQFHYDNFGNSVLLTDASGEANYSALYDLHSGKLMEEWNPNGLTLVNKIKGFNGSINFVFDNFNIIFNNSCGSAINLINSFSNIGIGGGTVRPLDFKLPEGMATCGASCKTSVHEDQNKNTKDGFNTEIKVGDVDKNGKFSNDTKKELRKGGLTEFQINELELETNYCKINGGVSLKCSSQIHPDEPYNANNTCCLYCTCHTGYMAELVHFISPIYICAESWHIRPRP